MRRILVVLVCSCEKKILLEVAVVRYGDREDIDILKDMFEYPHGQGRLVSAARSGGGL